MIEHFLPWLFPEMEIVERTTFRLTRDGDTEISDDADDLLEAVESELQKRRFGAVVRLEVSSSISRTMLSRLEERLGVGRENVYPIRGLLDLADVGQLYALDRPDLKYEPWVPYTQRRLATPAEGDIFAGDRPAGHRRAASVRLVRDERRVVRARRRERPARRQTLKTTVYRTSHDSALAPALIQAAENGKQSVCVVELKARFDERRNIEWARSLEQAGVHVVYGFPDMKIHAKTTLVDPPRGRRAAALRPHRHRQLPRDNRAHLRGRRPLHRRPGHRRRRRRPLQLRHRLRPPAALPQDPRRAVQPPQRLIEHIRDVASRRGTGQARRGSGSRCNNLTDTEIVEELYKASQAGVEIDIIVRAICTLIPGVAGLSENIRVRSVLGRFLEHSRLFCFEAGDDKTYLLGSADLMPRNLDHRIEVVVAGRGCPGCATRSRRSSRRCSPTTPRPGSSTRDGGWTARHARRRASAGGRLRPSSCVGANGARRLARAH